MVGWVLQPDWGENFLLSEGVEQSGEQALFAFLLCGAVTALSTTKSGIEQIPHHISEHVETENDQRQAKSKPERQAWRHLHVLTSLPAEHPAPAGDLGGQHESGETQRGL